MSVDATIEKFDVEIVMIGVKTAAGRTVGLGFQIAMGEHGVDYTGGVGFALKRVVAPKSESLPQKEEGMSYEPKWVVEGNLAIGEDDGCFLVLVWTGKEWTLPAPYIPRSAARVLVVSWATMSLRLASQSLQGVEMALRRSLSSARRASCPAWLT